MSDILPKDVSIPPEVFCFMCGASSITEIHAPCVDAPSADRRYDNKMSHRLVQRRAVFYPFEQFSPVYTKNKSSRKSAQFCEGDKKEVMGILFDIEFPSNWFVVPRFTINSDTNDVMDWDLNIVSSISEYYDQYGLEESASPWIKSIS